MDFFFPERLRPDFDARAHGEYWKWRMRGGADDQIRAQFAEATEKATLGELDNWADDPHGRLALIIVLDQFPRSLWRGTPRAFSQDGKALALALEGYLNGHYDALETPWYKTIYNLPLMHCEGPDHLERLDRAITLGQEVLAEAPAHLRPGYAFAAEQPVEVRKVIAAFGHHPHRNAVLGRLSTPEEETYLAEGRFPHLRPLPLDT
ncbi:DUF924 family protein [Sinorhizobium fredii]|uniref:DUF924 family protein n=1 Tax=Rhizobium fredii TaxID=380 RepID=UPI0012962A15|nr:DUF924 family protein [Sinorhizobium fredii]